MRFAHCTAVPAAPFIRLSIAHSDTTRPESVELEADVRVVAAGDDLRLGITIEAGAFLDDSDERLRAVSRTLLQIARPACRTLTNACAVASTPRTLSTAVAEMDVARNAAELATPDDFGRVR